MKSTRIKIANQKREYNDPSSPTAEEVGRYIDAVVDSFVSKGRDSDSPRSSRILKDGLMHGLASNVGLLNLVRADARAQERIKDSLPNNAPEITCGPQHNTLRGVESEIIDWIVEQQGERGRKLLDTRDTRVLLAIDVSGSAVPFGKVFEKLAMRVVNYKHPAKGMQDWLAWTWCVFDDEIIASGPPRGVSKGVWSDLYRYRVGGTDFNKVVAFADRIKTDLVVIMTDGIDIKPHPNFEIPTLWVVTAPSDLGFIENEHHTRIPKEVLVSGGAND